MWKRDVVAAIFVHQEMYTRLQFSRVENHPGVGEILSKDINPFFLSLTSKNGFSRNA